MWFFITNTGNEATLGAELRAYTTHRTRLFLKPRSSKTLLEKNFLYKLYKNIEKIVKIPSNTYVTALIRYISRDVRRQAKTTKMSYSHVVEETGSIQKGLN